MKLAIAVTVLIGAGIALLLWLGASHTSAEVSVEQIISGDATKRSITVQIAEMRGQFKPLEFDAVDAPPRGKDGKGVEETKEQISARVKGAKRMKVVYEGDDHFQLSNYNYVHIEGTWNPAKSRFEAASVSTQCPSHYNNEAKLSSAP